MAGTHPSLTMVIVPVKTVRWGQVGMSTSNKNAIWTYFPSTFIDRQAVDHRRRNNFI